MAKRPDDIDAELTADAERAAKAAQVEAAAAVGDAVDPVEAAEGARAVFAHPPPVEAAGEPEPGFGKGAEDAAGGEDVGGFGSGGYKGDDAGSEGPDDVARSGLSDLGEALDADDAGITRIGDPEEEASGLEAIGLFRGDDHIDRADKLDDDDDVDDDGILDDLDL